MRPTKTDPTEDRNRARNSAIRPGHPHQRGWTRLIAAGGFVERLTLTLTRLSLKSRAT